MTEKLDQYEIDRLIEKENRRKCVEQLLVKLGLNNRRTNKFFRYLKKEIEKDIKRR